MGIHQGSKYLGKSVVILTTVALAWTSLVRAAEMRADEDRATTRGVVVDPDGRPVAGAMIIWDARGKNLFKEYSDNRIPKTDAEGRFELSGGELTVFSLDWQLQSVRVRQPLKQPLKIVM